MLCSLHKKFDRGATVLTVLLLISIGFIAADNSVCAVSNHHGYKTLQEEFVFYRT
jgi:hypothetical protein